MNLKQRNTGFSLFQGSRQFLEVRPQIKKPRIYRSLGNTEQTGYILIAGNQTDGLDLLIQSPQPLSVEAYPIIQVVLTQRIRTVLFLFFMNFPPEVILVPLKVITSRRLDFLSSVLTRSLLIPAAARLVGPR